jgi:hypothetical protein
MKLPTRYRLLAACVAATLAPWTPEAVADSAAGNDTVIGNALNPGYPGGPRFVDPEADVDDRTPSGLLYDPPSVLRDKKKTGGWSYRGWIEAGGLGGDADEKNALYRMYRDLRNGFYLNNFGLQAEKPDEARFIEAIGGGVGRDDQYYGLQFGRYNDWKVRAFYNETPHTFTTTYRSLWNGVGTGNLTMIDPTRLPPGGGGATAAQVATNVSAFLATQPYGELTVVRKEGGARFEMRITDTWKAYVSFSSERREGARPFGAVWGGGGGNNNMEVPETIDYTTNEILGGLQYADALQSFNLQLAGSYFRNNTSTMTFESPMAVAPAAGTTGITAGSFRSGVFDLAPDNDFYSAKAEYARALPDFWNGRFTALASMSSSRQDDALVPYMTLPGLVVNGVTGGQWNTTAALSRQSADAQFDSRIVDLSLQLNPAKDLNVKARYRWNDTDNSTEYFACNPLTGQTGRILNDGSGISIVTNQANTPAWPTGSQYCNLATLTAYTRANGNVPAAGNNAIRNIPWEYEQQLAGLTADYRIARGATLNASYERETMQRTNRERDKTWEDKVKLAYANRALGAGTLRLTYEYDRRRGDEYNGDPYEPFLSASLGNLPSTGNVASWIHVLGSFRKYDLADRDQDILGGQFNYALTDELDGAIRGQAKRARYPGADYGRTDTHRQDSINLDLNYQPTAKLSAYGFYSWHSGRMTQEAIWPLSCTVGTNGVTGANFEHLCPEAGGPLFPLNRAWSLESKDRNQTGGAGVRYDFGRALVDLNATRAAGKTSISYKYDPVGLAANINPTQQALAGSGMPDLETTQTTVEANLLVPINKTWLVRFMYRHERGTVKDWHYDGVATVPTAGNVVYLDAGPQDYRTNVFGIFLRISL